MPGPAADLRTILHVLYEPKGAAVAFEIVRCLGKLVGSHAPDIREVVKPGAVAFADHEKLRILADYVLGGQDARHTEESLEPLHDIEIRGVVGRPAGKLQHHVPIQREAIERSIL